MTLTTPLEYIIPGIFIVLGVWLGSHLALRGYFRQKEYELLHHRYLEQGIDVVAAEIQHALDVVAHNYAHCIHLFKSFRDSRADFDLSSLSKGFLEFDSSKFNQIAHHRIQTLIGSNLVWDIYQLAIADTTNANDKITREIPESIRLKLGTNLIEASPHAMFDAALTELKRLHEGNDRFSTLLKELQVLALALETRRFRFEDLRTFRCDDSVRSALARLEEAFHKELTPYQESA